MSCECQDPAGGRYSKTCSVIPHAKRAHDAEKARRRGCSCSCCPHEEGSDCACDCHRDWLCSATVPPLEAARIRAYRQARVWEPNEEAYRAALSVFHAAFGSAEPACTCGPPSFPHEEHDSRCPKAPADAAVRPALGHAPPSPVSAADAAALLPERARWYVDGCEGLEDRASYYASGACARDAAWDLEIALARMRDLEAERDTALKVASEHYAATQEQAALLRSVHVVVDRMAQAYADVAGGTISDGVGFMQVSFPLLLSELVAVLGGAAPQDNGPGTLEVGVDGTGRMVVVNLPRDMTGHIVFSPQQAHDLAHLLVRKALEADPPTAAVTVTVSEALAENAVCPACVLGNPPDLKVRLCALHAAMAGPRFDPTNHHSALACPYCNPHGQLEPRDAADGLRAALERLAQDANRLCDRQAGGTYEADCRRSVELAQAALRHWRRR